MNPCQKLLENPQLLPAVIGACWAVHAVVESWLGKTDKVKAGSLLEAIYNVFVKPKEGEK